MPGSSPTKLNLNLAITELIAHMDEAAVDLWGVFTPVVVSADGS